MAIPYKNGPSKHFTWAEVDKHGFGIPLTVRARAIVHARNLEKLRTEVNRRRALHELKPTGIHVLSWYRTRAYNNSIGGAKYSRHVSGDGTDITLAEIDRLFPWRGGRTQFDHVCNTVFSKGGFGTYPAGNRHVDSRGWRARWKSWTP